jgi:hypothetical protein
MPIWLNGICDIRRGVLTPFKLHITSKLLRSLFLTAYVIGANGSRRILPSPRIVLKTGALIKEPYMFAY